MDNSKYESKMGFSTKIWGPVMWSGIHMISLNYPMNPSNEDKKHYKDFIVSLQYVLPCGACRDNLKKNLKEHPLTKKALKNRHTFAKWVYDLHELVNKMLEKNPGHSFNDVRDMYELFRAKCGKSTNTKENGCTKPINNVKTKCIINIVPEDAYNPGGSIHIDHTCFK